MMNYTSSPDSLQHRYFGHQHNSLNHVKLESDEEYVKGKKSKFKGRFEAQEAARQLGFRYLTSCFSYILRKARAFYNEFAVMHYLMVMIVKGHWDMMKSCWWILILSIPVTPFTSLDVN